MGRLKAALAKALVSFYPLAGRLAVDGNSRPEVDYNTEGAVFVVEHAGLAVDGALQFELLPEMRRLFIPCVDSWEPGTVVLAVQVRTYTKKMVLA